MTRVRRQTGQATVTTVLFLTVLLGMTGAVLDVGVWFNEDRKLQATTDAAALAAAQELPDSTALATTRAIEYGDKNGGGVDADVADWAPEAQKMAPYLKFLLQVDPGDAGVETMNPQERRAGILDALRCLVLERSRVAPRVDRYATRLPSFVSGTAACRASRNAESSHTSYCSTPSRSGR